MPGPFGFSNAFTSGEVDEHVYDRTDLLTQLAISYTRRCNWSAFPRVLLDAIGFETAALGCYTVTADQQRQKVLDQASEERLLMALSIEATQEGGAPPIAPSIPARIRMITR